MTAFQKNKYLQLVQNNFLFAIVIIIFVLVFVFVFLCVFGLFSDASVPALPLYPAVKHTYIGHF